MESRKDKKWNLKNPGRFECEDFRKADLKEMVEKRILIVGEIML